VVSHPQLLLLLLQEQAVLQQVGVLLSHLKYLNANLTKNRT
jgi:hypothetical protein